MARIGSMVALTVAGAMLVPGSLLAQNTGHTREPGAASHSHAGPAVDCTTLASPPWSGLPEVDRDRWAAARQSVMELSTPEAAIAAGFRPALGDIPGMGVHYVHAERSRDGIQVEHPDHLMFAPVDGEETLVGAAYAFIDVPDTDEPIPFDSDLARWHDHPQFAPEGQTLHMLHVWFVPSSNGPFAGLNFWLPFQGAGITPPSTCWMADPEISQQIQQVSFALVPADNVLASRIERRLAAEAEEAQPGDEEEARPESLEEEISAERQQILDDLDAAARENNLNAWIDAADRLLADLTPRERRRTAALLQALSAAQMSSAEREGIGPS
jgi:hypothetical protein